MVIRCKFNLTTYNCITARTIKTTARDRMDAIKSVYHRTVHVPVNSAIYICVCLMPVNDVIYHISREYKQITSDKAVLFILVLCDLNKVCLLKTSSTEV